MHRILLFDDREIRLLNTPAEHGVYRFANVESHEQAVRLLTPYRQTPHGLHQMRVVLADEGTSLDPFRLTDDRVIEEMAVRVVDRRVRLAKDIRADEVWFVPQEEPEPEQPAQPPAEPPKQKKLTWIELQFFDERTAKPVNNLRIILRTPDGNESFRTTNTEGLIRLEEIEPGSCDARCESKDSTVDDTLAFVAPGDPPAPDPKAKPLTGSTVWRCLEVDEAKINADGKGELGEAAKDWTKGGLATATRHKFRVKPLKKFVWIIELEHLHFNHDSATLLADHDIETDPKKPQPQHVTGLDVLAETLREADRSPQRRLLIAGHTDTSGSAAYNLPLSALRAESALACLTGDRARWVDISDSKHKVECYQVILKWVARDQGFNCDPGPVTNTNNAQTQAAVLEFQKQYNQTGLGATIGEDGIVGKETWGAFFDFYQLELKQVLKVDDAGLSALRGKIQFVDGSRKSVGCGENFPKEARGVDGFRSKENRRVEMLFFNENKLPKLTCHDGGKCTPGVCEVNDPKIFIPAIIPVNPVPPPPKPTIKFVKIMTSDPVNPPVAVVFKEDDDFSPRLSEQIRFHVSIEKLPPGFKGKCRVDVGRLTNKPAGSNPDVNGAFALIGRIEVDITAGADPLPVEVVWDGKATNAVAQQLSNRQTTNNNGGAAVNIPLHNIAVGDLLTHGLYVVDQVSAIETGGKIVAKERPADKDFSVPMICNLTFNANWPTDLAAYGLGVFQAQLEEALRRFGGRDYQIRAGSVTNRANVRFITSATVTNAQSVFLSVGGAQADGTFGSTPDGPAPLSDNIYAFHEGVSAVVDVFPGTFMSFNQAAGAIGPNDQADFRATYGPLGVGAAASQNAIGVATARAVSGAGAVTGAADLIDQAGISLSFDNDGMATVTSTNAATVPAARAADLQRAMRRFVMMVGNTTNHEAAHAFGIASRVRANNRLTIDGTTLTSPLDGDGGAHNKVTNNTNIVDAGGTRAFSRRVEVTGVTQVFNAQNMKFLRDCIPFDRTDN